MTGVKKEEAIARSVKIEVLGEIERCHRAEDARQTGKELCSVKERRG